MSKKIALALASGGARGLAHIGVIEELERRGYTISSIAGSSMGAVVAGIYASGNLKEFKKWVSKLNKLDVLGLIDFTFTSYGFIKGEKIFAELKKQGFISDKNIEELSIPLSIIAVDLTHNKEHVFRSGSLLHAIRSSISIPNVFTPVETKSEILVDGGVLNPLPIEHLKTNDRNGTILLAVDINGLIPFENGNQKEKSKEIKETQNKGYLEFIRDKIDDLLGTHNHSNEDKLEKLGYFDIFTRSFQLMQGRITQNIIKDNPPDVLVQLSKDLAGIFEFYRAKEIIEIGRKACAKELDKKGM